MFEEVIDVAPGSWAELDLLQLSFDRPLEPCPRCGSLLSAGHLEAADAGWADSCCHACGVVLAA